MKLIINLPVPDRKARQIIGDNFEQIQNEFELLHSENKDINNRLKALEESRVTYKKLKEVDSYWRDRLKRVALGTDEETIEIVLRKILVDEGIIKSDVNSPRSVTRTNSN